MEEIWREIEGYKNYQVSSLGRVRSLNYKRTGEVRVLKAWKDKDGYLIIGLHKNGTQRTFRIHRLVGEAFIPNPENKPQIDHIDTNKTNNSVENLKWATNKENSNNELSRKHNSEAQKGRHHSEETKRKMSEALKGEKNTFSKRVEIFKDGLSLGIFPCTMELERKSEELFGTRLLNSNISRVCTGKKPQYKNFTFKYVD